MGNENHIVGSSKNLSFMTLLPWIKSAVSTGNKVHLLLLDGNNVLATQVRSLGVNVIVYEDSGVPHHERFLRQYDLLKNLNGYCTVTDTRDVIFQTDPAEWLKKNLGNHRIVVSSEGIAYKNEHWGDRNLRDGYSYLYEELKNSTIYNVGVIGGYCQDVASLCLLLYTMSKNNPAPVSDQSSLNVIVNMPLFSDIIMKSKSSEGWALHAGTLCKTKDYLRFKEHLNEPEPQIDHNGKAWTHDGQCYSIFHQYERIV